MMSGQLDVALLDNNMPEMTGPNAVKLFRAGEVGGGERLPILMSLRMPQPMHAKSQFRRGQTATSSSRCQQPSFSASLQS